MANEKSYLGDTSKYDDIIKGLEKELEKTTGAKPVSEFTKAAAKMRALNKKEEPQYEANTEAIQAYLASKKEKTPVEPEYKINQEAMEKYAKEKDLKIVAKKVNEKLGVISYGITRNKKRIATIQREIDELEGKGKTGASPEKKAFLSLTTSLSVIASSMKKINAALGNISKMRMAPEIAAPILAPGLPMMGKKEKESGMGFLDLLKLFFMNPAVVAGLAGIVYSVLPKELTDRIKGFLGGFASGLDKALGEDDKSGLKGFVKAVKIAGIAITTYFGLKLIASVAEAITIAVKLAKLLGVSAVKLGRVGKATGKMIGSNKGIAAAVAIGGAAVTAGALMSGDDEKDIVTRKQTEPSKPKPSATQSKQELNVPSGTTTPSASQTQMTTPAERPSPSTTYTSGAEAKAVSETGSAREAMAFFQSKGWTKEQAAGIVGNLQAESGANLRTDIVGDGGKAYGIAQWHADRQAKFQREFKKPIQQSTFKEQLEFVNWELNNDEKHAANMLRRTTSPDEAAASFDRYYERSAGRHVGKRQAYALALAGKSSDEIDKMITPSSSAPVSTAASSGAKINDASKNVKAASMPNGKTEVSSVNSTKQTGRNEKNKTPSHDIPSPIANRGSLEYYTKHSTFYV